MKFEFKFVSSIIGTDIRQETGGEEIVNNEDDLRVAKQFCFESAACKAVQLVFSDRKAFFRQGTGATLASDSNRACYVKDYYL